MSGSARPRHARYVACLVAGVVLLTAGCGDDDDDDASAATEATQASGGTAGSGDLAGSSWTLASYAAVTDAEVAATGTATLDFGADGSTLTGSTGCNRFAGTYTQTGSDLTVALGPMTLAACAGQAAADQEAAIVARLPQVASFQGELELLDGDGVTVLTYQAGLSSLEGTSWTATGINNGRGGLESTAATETVTAEFGADGMVSGFAGCNNYTGTYAVTGDDGIAITGVATTLKACADDAMALESQYVAALGAATTFELSGDSLTLRDDGGAMQVTYVLAG